MGSEGERVVGREKWMGRGLVMRDGGLGGWPGRIRTPGGVRHRGREARRFPRVEACDASLEEVPRCLPGLTAAMIDSVLARRLEQGETALIKAFRGTL